MQTAVNRNATKGAKELLSYLCDVAGKKIITGQHTQTKDMEEIGHIFDKTGKRPKLRGFELLSYSPNIDYEESSFECLKEVYDNRGTLKTAMDWARSDKGGILTFSFHWFSPMYGSDKSFYTEHTSFDPEKVLEEGTPERKAFYHDMDVIADLLKPFCDEDIPVLWRPFHESDGTWFWWGSKGPVVAMELYKLMFDYYVNEKHLDNLLWVWNAKTPEAYPGDDKVDVISIDIYLPEYKPTDYKDEYEELVNNTTKNKVAALAEIGYLPDLSILEKSRVPWAYFMTWSREFIVGQKFNTNERLKAVYGSSYALNDGD